MTNKMHLFWLIYLSLINSTCFGRCLSPSSVALDCICSFWYCPPILLPAGVMDEMELMSSISCVTSHISCVMDGMELMSSISCVTSHISCVMDEMELMSSHLMCHISHFMCHGWDGTNEFHLIHDTNRQQYRCTTSEAVNTVKCSWCGTKTSPGTCTAD